MQTEWQTIGAVWSGSALFAQAYLSENLGSLRHFLSVLANQRFCHYCMSRCTTKPTVKTRISLGIHPVRSEFSLSAWRKFVSLSTGKVHSEDSDQTGQMPRLSWVFAGCTGHSVGFVMCRLNYGMIHKLHLSRAMRKCVLCYMRTTKAQISLRICAVWSAPLLFAA